MDIQYRSSCFVVKHRLLVGGPGIANAASLAKWIRREVEYASSLPPG